MPPRAGDHVAGGDVDTPLGGDDQTQSQLSGAGVVHLLRPQHRDVRGHHLGHAVNARHQRLNNTQSRHLSGDRYVGDRTHVRRHEELDVVGGHCAGASVRLNPM